MGPLPAPGLLLAQWILAAGPAYYGGGLSLQAIRDTVVVALDALDSYCTVSLTLAFLCTLACAVLMHVLMHVIGGQVDEVSSTDDGSRAASTSNREELRGHAVSIAENLDAVLVGGQV
jgi:hypothetical protein